MAIVDLDRQQGFAFIAEMNSTRNLLAYGIRVVRTGAFIDTTRDPILTMLSIGVEKLYKLTLGLMALERDRKWPDAGAMQERGHKLVPMHEEVMEALRTRTADKSDYVRGLVAGVDADPVVLPVIEALDLYGRMGRFYYLDLLGDRPQSVNPQDTWQEIESAVLTDPEVAGLYQRASKDIGDTEAWDAFTRALHGRIASAVEGIWIMIAAAGRNHALGPTGDSFGFEVHPDAVGRQ